jgi:hypothetical protein
MSVTDDNVKHLTGDDQVLVVVFRLWSEADEHDDQAAMFEDEARNLRAQADDKRDEAEELWKPLLADHPEWKEALDEGTDPRVAR